MDPDVPTGPALIVSIGAEVAVVLLTGNECEGHAVHLRFQARVVRETPGIGGSVEVLPDVFADPLLLARTLPEAGEQGVLFDIEEALLEVDAHALAGQAGDRLGLKGNWNEAVLDGVGGLGLRGGLRGSGGEGDTGGEKGIQKHSKAHGELRTG